MCLADLCLLRTPRVRCFEHVRRCVDKTMTTSRHQGDTDSPKEEEPNRSFVLRKENKRSSWVKREKEKQLELGFQF